MALRIGLVGAGRTGFRRAYALKAYPDVEIAAVAEPNRRSRDSFARTFGARLAVSDHRRLAAEPTLDVVYISSPPATHSTIAVDCLREGRHVICEQPMAVTMPQAEEMMVAAEEGGARLFIALPQRYDPVNQEADRLIEAGELGYPFFGLVAYLENEFSRLNDWHDWKGTWESGGGGILMEHGSEIVDLLHLLMGSVQSVSTICTRFAIEPLNKGEDSCLLGLEFEEEATVQLALTGAARYSPWPDRYPGMAMRLEIYGLDGSLQIVDSEPRFTVSTKAGGHRALASSDIHTALPTDMLRDFLDCIAEGREPLVTPEHAREALRVVLAGYKSSQMKRRVELLEQL